MWDFCTGRYLWSQIKMWRGIDVTCPIAIGVGVGVDSLTSKSSTSCGVPSVTKFGSAPLPSHNATDNGHCNSHHQCGKKPSNGSDNSHANGRNDNDSCVTGPSSSDASSSSIAAGGVVAESTSSLYPSIVG
jgi:hypothetical protein